MRNLVEKPDEQRYGHTKNVVLKFLNARVSFPSWILALSSAGIAYIALFLLLFGSGLGAFGEELILGALLWSSLMVVSTTATIIGLIFAKRIWLLRSGAFFSFTLWIFGALAFALAGQAITSVIVVIPWLLFYAYVYLASFFRQQTGL
jgi:hypothetical protein